MPSTSVEQKISCASTSVIWVWLYVDLTLHRFKVVDEIHSYRRRIDQVEVLGVLGQDRRERAGDNVSKSLVSRDSNSERRHCSMSESAILFLNPSLQMG